MSSSARHMDEGLGLPLLEAQYGGGLPVTSLRMAPAIFREVLGVSGIFIDPADPVAAATRIEAVLSERHWRSRYVACATQNLERAGTRWRPPISDAVINC